MVYLQEIPIYDEYSSSHKHFHVMMTSHGKLNCFKALRLRGRGDDPNHDSKNFEIPYLTNAKFRWDGLPCIDFREKVLNVLENGLGSMLINGGTLLETVKRQDPGGVLGNPMRAVAAPDVVRDSRKRNVKAFHCILNYMHPQCYIYKYFMREHPGDGITIYCIICARNPIPVPPRWQTAREDAWNRMTMESLRLAFTVKGFMTWVEIVLEQGRLLNKNGTHMKDKFLAGLPKRFEYIRTAMQNDMRFVYPATYGGLPGNALGANALTVHPLAGQQHIFPLSIAYVPQWVTKAAEEGYTPKGYNARSAVEMDELLSCTPDDFVEILTTDITKSTRCIVCNGDGHAATQDFPNGERVVCPTRLLGTGKNSDSFNKYSKYKKQNKDMAHEIEQLHTELEEAHKLYGSSSRDERRRPTSKFSKHTTSQLEDSHDASAAESSAASQTEKSDSDDDSADSAGSAIHDFADMVSDKSRRPFKKHIRKGTK